MIIVEGPDNVGKSTFIQQCLDAIPELRILHRERYKPEHEETIATSYLKALLPEDGDRMKHAMSVADRFLASECVYGALFRKGCRMTDGEHMAIRNMLISYNAVIVHCDIPNKKIKEGWKDRKQLYDDPIAIAEAYRKRMELIFRGLPVFKYNWTSSLHFDQFTRILKKHRKHLQEVKDQLSWWSAMPFGVGQLVQPDVILVGEKLSPRMKVEVPFANGPAGDFLAWSLEGLWSRKRHAALRTSTYITNADKGRGSWNTSLLREELNHLVSEKTVIIALGLKAEALVHYVVEHLQKRPRAVHTIPHPQYWRRFHWKEKDKYVNILHKACNSTLRVH